MVRANEERGISGDRTHPQTLGGKAKENVGSIDHLQAEEVFDPIRLLAAKFANFRYSVVCERGLPA